MNPESTQFSDRKKDHIALALKPKNQANESFEGKSVFSSIHLNHEAFPELDFHEVSLKNVSLGQSHPTPFYVSSMTAGHDEASTLNHRLAEACQAQAWMFALGSQRRQLTEPQWDQEAQKLRKNFPNLFILGNLGLSQVIHSPLPDIERVVDSLQAQALCIHTNPLQECLQEEGTPNFARGLEIYSKTL